MKYIYSHYNISRVCFAFLNILYLIFIASASFYLTSKIPDSEVAIKMLLQKGSAFQVSFHNLKDISTNILLYMPFGFLLGLYIATYRRIRVISFYILIGFLISLIVEIIQAFIGRFSDLSDVISNGFGYVIGYLVAFVSVNYFHLKPGALIGITQENEEASIKSISGLRFVYIVITYITCLLPLNISVSLSEIYEKLNSVDGERPRIILDPWYNFSNGIIDYRYLFLIMLMFIPLAFLSDHIEYRKNRHSFIVPAFHCLLLGLVIELSNVFILSGSTDVFVPLFGFSIGMLVSFLMFKIRASTVKNIKLDSEYNYIYYSSALFYAFFLFVFTLSPFEFELALKAIKNKMIYDSNFIPFKAHFSARSISSAIDIIRELLKFSPLGALLYLSIRSVANYSNKLPFLIVVSIGIIYACVLELLQLMVVGRYVDITDALLAGIGCFIGALILPLFKSVSSDRSLMKAKSR